MRSNIVFLAGLAATLLASTAFAETATPSDKSWLDGFAMPGQWYLGAKMGANWIAQNTNVAQFAPGQSRLGTVHYDNGYIGGLDLGHAFNNGFRLELEGMERYNGVTSVMNYGPGRGALRSYSAMVNVLYDIPVDFLVQPYVGVGVGAASYEADHIRGDDMPYPSYFGGDRTNLAYQGFAGLVYNLHDNLAVTVEYRYVDRPDNYPNDFRTTYQAHSTLLGIRYTLGAPAHEVVAQSATYVPPPPAPGPANPRTYLVFFDFNKSDLTGDARGIVDKAAANAESDHITRLEVTGYTDTVGSEAYNMRLSRQRAESVLAELQVRGIPASDITIFAKGKHDLLVPTAGGVREPQNRRVQIVYSAAAPSS
jgi:OOP family OmpA-OmpF porin